MKLLKGLEAVAELGNELKDQHSTLIVLKKSLREYTRTIRQFPDYEHGRIQQETERMIRNHIELMKQEQEVKK